MAPTIVEVPVHRLIVDVTEIDVLLFHFRFHCNVKTTKNYWRFKMSEGTKITYTNGDFVFTYFAKTNNPETAVIDFLSENSNIAIVEVAPFFYI